MQDFVSSAAAIASPNAQSISDNLLSNLIWLTLGVISGRLISLAKAYFQKRALSIEGVYLTSYEDETSGRKNIISTTAEISQKALTISGKTTFGDQEWQLSGQIEEGKYVHGSYAASSVHDKGRGNFYLEIQSCENRMVTFMSGTWSGYDSRNKKITSGLYSFQRIDGSEIKTLTSQTLGKYKARIISISEKELGKSYIQIDEESFAKSTYMVAVPAPAKTERFNSKSADVVSGFCVSRTYSKDEFVTAFPRITNLPKFIRHATTIGVIASVAIAEDHKRKGLGYRLVAHSIDSLQKQGSEALVMVGWKNDSVANIQGVASKLSFREVKVFDNYWFEDSTQKQYECPTCGQPPCKCSAVLFARAL